MSIYSPEAFVYCWTNLDNGNKYIGYHKGSPDDGYICSSKSDRFWKDWESCEWSRQIIASGSTKDCIRLELKILQTIDITSDEYYNNNVGGGFIMTEEIRKKISKTKTNCVTWNKGIPRSEEDKRKISESLLGERHPGFGKKRNFTAEWKSNIAEAAKNRKKVKCEHCMKEITPQHYARWHGDRCKSISPQKTLLTRSSQLFAFVFE